MAGLILLGKNSLTLYSDNTKRVYKLNFKPEIVKDIEILNLDQFNLYVKSYVSANKIPPNPLIMVVSHNMFFEKDFPPLTKGQQTAETQKFIDNIPFETVASTSFGSENAYKILATNDFFIQEVRNAFENLGFTINIALPSILFGNIGEELIQTTIKIIYSKYPSLKQYNLLKDSSLPKSTSSEDEPIEEKERENNKKINRKNLITIGVFVLFLVILFVIVFMVLSSQGTSGDTIVNPSK